MNRQNFIKRLSGNALFRTVCILIMLTVLAMCAVTGVYAKYITSENFTDSAQVATVGITTFELKEHAPIAQNELTADNIADMVKNNNYHVLSNTEEISGSSSTTYSVPPGVNIPKDPFIRLEMKSDVSYTLYLKVTKVDFPTYTDANGNEKDLVTYNLRNNWVLDEDIDNNGENGVYVYKYAVDIDTDNYVFAAGTQYTYDKGKEIQILEDNKIRVSENYSTEIKDKSDLATFSIKFEAYIQQVLNVA